MAKNSGNAHITITVNGNEAINFYNKLKKEEADLTKLAKQGDEQAQKKLHDLQGMLTDVEKELTKVDDVLKGKMFANLNTLEKMAKRVKDQMRYTDNANDLRKLQIQYKGLTDRIRELTNTANDSGTAFGRLFRRALEYTGFYMVLNRGKAVISDAIKGNLSLSDSISDIQKVSGLSEESVKGLVSQIEKIDSRNAPTALNNMAYAAGKLGIKGSENLLGFTRAADKLNVALKEYLGDGAEGVVQLMKFANVMGTTEQFGVEQALLKTGSALNYMTQSTAAAADYMIEFAGRFGPIARQARMTSGDVIGLASALDALTVGNEEAATSLQKFVVKLLSSPTTVSKALGIDATTAKQMVETGKSIELVEMAISKLGERAKLYGVSGISSVIGDIGAKGQAQRLIKTLATLANNTQMLRDYVTMANQAFEEGTSVIDEYNIKNQNAAAIMERMRNSWEKVLVNSENVGAVKELAQELFTMSESIQRNTYYMESLKVTMGALFGLLKAMIQALPVLLYLMVSLGTVKLAAAIGGWVMQLGSFIKSIYLAITAHKALQAVLVKSLWGAAAVGISLVVGELIDWISKTNEAKRQAEEFNRKIKDLTTSTKEYHEETYKEERAMNQLFEKAKAANAKTDEKKRLIAEINTKYGKYLEKLLTEKSTLDEIKKAQERANDALRESIALKMQEKDIREAGDVFTKKSVEGLESYRSGVEKTGLSTENIAKAQQQIVDLVEKNLGKAGYQGPNQATVSVLKELAKTDNRWNSVLNNRKDVGTIYDFMREQKKEGANYYGTDPISVGRREAAYRKEKELVSGNREAYAGIYNYIEGIIQMNNAMKGIEKKYQPFIKGLIKEEKEGNDDGNIEVIETPDPAEERERKRALREEFEDMKKQSTGIISKLEEYYRLQETAIQEARSDGELTEEQAKMMVRSLNVLKNDALATARRAITTGETEAWDAMKKTELPNALADTSDLSVNLLKTIQEVPVKMLHDNLAKFNGGVEVLGLDSRAFFDQINSKAAGNARESARLRAAVFSEAEKMRKQFEFVEKAQDAMQKNLEQMGLVTETYEEFARRLQAGIMEKPDRILKLNTAQRSARSQMVERFNINGELSGEQPQDMGVWMQELTDNGQAEWLKALPELQKWVADTGQYKEQIQQLYDMLKQLQRVRTAEGNTPIETEATSQLDQTIASRMSDKEAYTQMSSKFIGTIPYSIDIENEQEALQWIRDFATSASGELEQWAQAFPQIEQWVDMIKQKEQDGEAFGDKERKALQQAIPFIQALYYQMDNYANNISGTIQKQVQQMTSRTPIGIDEMRQQMEQRVALTEAMYNAEIQKAGAGTSAAVELERQKYQAITGLRYQFAQQEYQIQEQLGVTWSQQYQNEVAKYKNMLDKQMISEEQFQKKKRQLQAQNTIQYAQYYQGLMSNLVDSMQQYEISAVEAKYDVLISQAQGNEEEQARLEEEKENEKLEIQKKYADIQFAVKASEIIANTAVAIMQAYAQLGPIGGSIAAAMLSATGAMQLAIANVERQKVKNLQGKSSSSKSSQTKSSIRLVKGMLTYDEGNVQTFQQAKEGGAYTVLGNDGRVYSARKQTELKTGIVRQPIATLVGGQPSLVAERGPEMIIGRETLRSMTQFRPDLVEQIVRFDRNRRRGFRLYDEGNVGGIAGMLGAVPQEGEKQRENNSEAILASLEESRAVNEQMLEVLSALTLQLQKGIKTSINKYGSGGLVEEVADGIYMLKKRGTNTNINRLFKS